MFDEAELSFRRVCLGTALRRPDHCLFKERAVCSDEALPLKVKGDIYLLGRVGPPPETETASFTDRDDCE